MELETLINSQIASLEAMREAEQKRKAIEKKITASGWDAIKPFLTLGEAARLLTISLSTMTCLSRENGFPGNRIGKKWVIDAHKLREWVIANPHYLEN